MHMFISADLHIQGLLYNDSPVFQLATVYKDMLQEREKIKVSRHNIFWLIFLILVKIYIEEVFKCEHQ